MPHVLFGEAARPSDWTIFLSGSVSTSKDLPCVHYERTLKCVLNASKFIQSFQKVKCFCEFPPSELSHLLCFITSLATRISTTEVAASKVEVAKPVDQVESSKCQVALCLSVANAPELVH